MTKDEDDPTGKKDTRFQLGKSGNPKGWPKKTAKPISSSAFDILTDFMVPITKDGVEQEVIAEVAMQLKNYQQAIDGDKTACRAVIKMIEKREAYFAKHKSQESKLVTLKFEKTDPINADQALMLLGITKVDERWADDITR